MEIIFRLSAHHVSVYSSVVEWLQVLDLRSVGRGFKSCSRCTVECGMQPGQVVYTHASINNNFAVFIWLRGVSWEGVTVSLATYLPCVTLTDNRAISTCGLLALEREMTTPPTLLWSMEHSILPSSHASGPRAAYQQPKFL